MQGVYAALFGYDVLKPRSAAHYIFEYAHPFYDGNGRTGCYLLSLFLENSLSQPTVLSLSRAIANNRFALTDAFLKDYFTMDGESDSVCCECAQ